MLFGCGFILDRFEFKHP